ncbi:thioredoxin family protein [Demequina sp. TTPB684]|uniref:thioredoxin family protein n=1 Tax=unclassified Demequina TaxID=2620311 RepID=UPI001CF0EBB1|nr:thioredoxin family protein [Demequina sp. TMPB413]MCB2413221.1 thioredoxin family protein [Demequina sp. TTPB684]UPU88204.1 thioredoxin family protein [Demequina sp. TMPB413]
MDVIVRLAAVLVVLAASAVAYVWWSRRQGRVQHVTVPGALTPEDLGAPRGLRATFVQFSTPICAKCPPTRALLLRVAAEQPHVVHIEIDASERLDLARRLDIMRTPTTLVLDADGVVVSRMNGAPTEAQARAALAELPPPGEYSI